MGAWLGGALGRKGTVLISAGGANIEAINPPIVLCVLPESFHLPRPLTPPVPLALGWMLIAIAQNIPMILAGRWQLLTILLGFPSHYIFLVAPLL